LYSETERVGSVRVDNARSKHGSHYILFDDVDDDDDDTAVDDWWRYFFG